MAAIIVCTRPIALFILLPAPPIQCIMNDRRLSDSAGESLRPGIRSDALHMQLALLLVRVTAVHVHRVGLGGISVCERKGFRQHGSASLPVTDVRRVGVERVLVPRAGALPDCNVLGHCSHSESLLQSRRQIGEVKPALSLRLQSASPSSCAICNRVRQGTLLPRSAAA